MPNEEPPKDPQAEFRRKQPGYVVLTLVLVAAMVLVALFLPTRLGRQWWLWAWIINLALMFVLLGTISLSIGAKRRWWSFLVDERNMVSLSRFQIALWTLVVLSGFFTIGLARVGDWTANRGAYECAAPQETAASAEGEATIGPEETTAPAGAEATPGAGEESAPEEEVPCAAAPLDLQLPEVLWALMGISTATAVLSPLIKDDKVSRTSAQDRTVQTKRERAKLALKAAGEVEAEIDRASREESGPTYSETLAKLLESDPELAEELTSVGAMVVRRPDKTPRFSDLFRGELVNNVIYLDMAKVQNFLFTIVAVVSYAIALGAAIAGAESIAGLFQFPDVSVGLLAVLGISHSGYLVSKVVNNPPA